MKLKYDKDSRGIYTEGFVLVVDMESGDVDPRKLDPDEYGHKFAAVDDLMKSLEECIRFLEYERMPNQSLVEQAKSAIAKAKGEHH